MPTFCWCGLHMAKLCRHALSIAGFCRHALNIAEFCRHALNMAGLGLFLLIWSWSFIFLLWSGFCFTFDGTSFSSFFDGISKKSLMGSSIVCSSPLASVYFVPASTWIRMPHLPPFVPYSDCEKKGFHCLWYTAREIAKTSSCFAKQRPFSMLRWWYLVIFVRIPFSWYFLKGRILLSIFFWYSSIRLFVPSLSSQFS